MATENIIKVEGGRLIVNVPLSKGIISKTGKSLVLYSTGGFAGTGNGVKVNIVAIGPVVAS